MRSTIEMAREVGFTVGLGSPALEKFERLIAIARADEREACAKVADGYVGADPIADAIRARGETK
jgi:hypothetical protein